MELKNFFPLIAKGNPYMSFASATLTLAKEFGESSSLRTEFLDLTLCRILPKPLLESIDGSGPKSSPSQFRKELFKRLPLIDVEVIRDGQGYISITVLAPKDPFCTTDHLFNSIVSDRLVPGRAIPVISSQSLPLTFSLLKDELFMLHQVAVELPLEELNDLENKLPRFTEEIKLHLKNAAYSEKILSVKATLFDLKALSVHRRMLDLMERFSSYTPKRLLDVVLWQSAFFPKNFDLPRSEDHLFKVLYTLFTLKERVEKNHLNSPSERHLEVRLMPAQLLFPFGKRPALGIAIALNHHAKRELFNDTHVLKSVLSFFPNAQFIPDSYVAFKLGGSIKLLYLEVEKGDGTSFNRMDSAALKAGLPSDLKLRIERLIHPVFMPESEETLVHQISKLAGELREAGDIPQVTISYERQDSKQLVFFVVLLRVLQPEDSPLSKVLQASKTLECKFHQVSTVGFLNDVFPKEANAFSVRVDKKAFLRKDGSIDLFRARCFVADALKASLGDMRDVNGGMIAKQTEIYTGLKALLPDLTAADEFLLENFFYSITPIAMQGILPPGPLKQWFNLALQLVAKPNRLAKKPPFISHFDGQHCMLVIATKEPSLKEYISSSIEQLAMSDLDIARAHIEIDDMHYVAYIYRHHDPSRQRLFIQVAKEAIENWNLRFQQKQTLRLNMPYGIGPLDPRIGGDQQSGIVKRMLYDGLMRLDKEGEPTPAIAKRFELSEDQLTYTFHLREAKWSNGDPVIAYDFEYAWKKVLDPGFQTHFAYAFFMIKNARAANEGLSSIDEVGVRAIDDKTLEVKLEHPAPYFLELTAHWTYFPVSSKLDSSHPGWAYSAADAYISCGPFKLTRYDYGTKLELEANPHYWDAESVKLEKIEIFTIPDLNVVLKMYENDELDWIGQPFSVLPTNQIAELSIQNKLIETPISAITWLDVNTESFPFNSKRMRQAFCLAIQRAKLQENSLIDNYRPAMSILPSSVQVSSEPYFQDGDIEKAKVLFDDALEELGLTRDKLPPISLACADGPQQMHVAEVIKEQLEELFKIEVQFKVYSWEEFFNRRNNSFFQLSLLTWYCWYSDPSYVLDVFKFRTNALNATQWENATYISLLEQAQVSLDPEERKKLYIKAERILIDESPAIPLFFDNDLYLKKDRLKGYSFSQTGDVDFKEAYMERLI